MSFKMPLSKEDSDAQRNLLEELFTTQKDDCKVIDTATVHLCMKIFEKTFADEICPRCKEGLFIANHLGYYNIIVKRCINCCYTINISHKPD